MGLLMQAIIDYIYALEGKPPPSPTAEVEEIVAQIKLFTIEAHRRLI